VALFNQSTKAVSAAVLEIADAVGASADTDMQGRAFRSLNAAVGFFNTRANWDFLLVESVPVNVFGPFNITGVSCSATNTSAAAPAGHGFVLDDLVTGPGFSIGTRVTATAAGGIGINTTILPSIGPGVVVVTSNVVRDRYALPSAWKAPYTAKLLAAQVTLRPLRRRSYDRSAPNEFQTSTPSYYDVFNIGGKGTLGLVLPPNASDALQLRYYRRMTQATASGDTGALDIPQDYDSFLVAWAKWHFITDKGEGRSEQGQTWISFAQEGIKTMLSDQTRIPDEDLAFQYGAAWFDFGDANSTRRVNWDY